MFNVAYDNPKTGEKTILYLAEDCDHETAIKWHTDFIRRYVGMPFPNGKGFYPYNNVRIVERR